jgi:DNA invertase Pin-like site-specific DNA recombinase
MTVIGYARVSTTDQDLSIQEAALQAAGCDLIRAKKQTGTSTQGRAELRTVLDFIGKDVLLVTRVDRLARSIGDLQDIVRTSRPGREPKGDRAADRHQHGRRQVFPRHAGRLR